jgi:hypothetical protein
LTAQSLRRINVKTRKRSKFERFGFVVAVLLVSLVAAPSVSEAAIQPPAFNNGSLKGSYGVLLNQWNSHASGSKPFALVGVFDFDGAGNLSISSFTKNDGGTVTTGTGSGTYSVKNNGTGSMSITLSSNDAGTFSIVIDAKGNGFQMMLTSNCKGGCGTSIMSGTAVATGGSSFSNASLKGGYESLFVTWTSTQNPSAENDLGIFTFDGAGKVTASLTQDFAGKVTTIKASGTYSVNSDGSGSMTLTAKQGSITLAFAINSAGKGSQLISATSGEKSVSSGTTTHQ